MALVVAALPLATQAAADRRADVLEKAAEILEARYTDEAKGKQLAKLLRDAGRDGRFADIIDPQAYAKALTEAMRQSVPDLHLAMTYEPDREYAAGGSAHPGHGQPRAGSPGLSINHAPTSAGQGSGMQMMQRRDDSGAMRPVLRTQGPDGRTLDQLARINFGLDRVEQLEDNIGYIQLSQFIPAALSRETLRAAIALIAQSDAVIFDLRGNPGGSPDAVAELLSPFFPAEGGPVEVHAAEVRATGERRSFSTDPTLARPKLAQAPLFVVVDERTGSAAEMFAYHTRRLGRGTVVGKTTAGAGQGAGRHSVGNGFALLLSETRILTGSGWERVGVTPDVEAESAQALDRAIALAKEAIAAKG